VVRSHSIRAATCEPCSLGARAQRSTWLRGDGRLAEAEAALSRAAELPSPFPIQRVALADLTAMQFARLPKEPPEAQPKIKEQIRANLRDLAGRGTYPPLVSGQLADIARGVDEPELALFFSEAWVHQAPKDDKALHSRFLSESTLGALQRAANTSKELLARTPNDATLVNQRAVVEYRQGFFAYAAASCFEALRLDPKVPDAAAILTMIESELRRRQAFHLVVLEKLRMRAAMTLAHQGQHAEAVKAVTAEKAGGTRPSRWPASTPSPRPRRPRTASWLPRSAASGPRDTPSKRSICCAARRGRVIRYASGARLARPHHRLPPSRWR
jgi:tetratricopeptide (TPR) repeat protein